MFIAKRREVGVVDVAVMHARAMLETRVVVADQPPLLEHAHSLDHNLLQHGYTRSWHRFNVVSSHQS